MRELADRARRPVHGGGAATGGHGHDRRVRTRRPALRRHQRRPGFTFDEAVSFQINCETQEEIDHYWERLTEGGEEGPCGWLKDRFGLSWQVVPTGMEELFSDPDQTRAERAMRVMFTMRKLDIAALRRAADGTPAA